MKRSPNLRTSFRIIKRDRSPTRQAHGWAPLRGWQQISMTKSIGRRRWYSKRVQLGIRCQLKTEGVCGQWNLSPGCQSIFRGVRTRAPQPTFCSATLIVPPPFYPRVCPRLSLSLSLFFLRVHDRDIRERQHWLGGICRTACATITNVRPTTNPLSLSGSD